MVGGGRKRRVRWRWIALAVVVVALFPVAVLGIPILTHVNQGESGQQAPASEWPSSVTATGDDGRTRSFDVLAAEPGASVDTSALVAGQHIVVSGTGFDGARGIYVAVCRIPKNAETKPGPCVGGVPDTKGGGTVGAVEYAPSNWINDDWAWKLFGARSYDNNSTGTFTAYIEVGEPTSETLDCRVEKCGIFTRNDHTALTDRAQDLYVPVGFVK